MDAEFATLIQRLEAFQVALLEAAMAAAALEELLGAAEPEPEPEPTSTNLPATWKVDGTTVQTAPGEPWINVYEAIKIALETRDQLEVPSHAEPSTTGSV